MKVIVSWTALVLALIGLGVGIEVGLGHASSLPAPAPSPSPAAMRAEVVAAFRQLTGVGKSTVDLAEYVQGVDGPMASSLARGATSSSGATVGLLFAGTITVSAIRATSASVATVDFVITVAGGGRFSFVGTAVLTAGRWKASWATVCMLVEQEGVVCPDPPPGVAAPDPIPYSVTAQQLDSAQSPDLIQPGALALTSSGDLLVADAARDQIVEWHPGGTLTVFAGTGQPGFSGDGGPAVDARLDAVGGMALSANDTLYFVDGNRVRAISPRGLITTVAGDGKYGSPGDRVRAVDTSLEPNDVAVAADRTLYIAEANAISKVAPDGIISTLVQGGPPTGVDVVTQRGSMLFSPWRIALDRAGNLDVFSFAPNEIFQVSSAGKVRFLGSGYASHLTTAPDGEVFIADHGESIGRIAGDRVREYLDLMGLEVNGLWLRGEEPGLEPNGIAVAPSGTIYLDADNGSGYPGGTSFVEVLPNATVRALPIHTPVSETLPREGSPAFPSSIYPPPSPAKGTDPTSCPAAAGLEPFGTASTAAAKAVARHFNTSSIFFGDLRVTDRSWWDQLFHEWVGADYDMGAHTLVSVGPASRDTFAAAVGRACGEQLVQESLVIDVGPSGYSPQVSHLYFLNRAGHPLVYFQAA